MFQIANGNAAFQGSYFESLSNVFAVGKLLGINENQYRSSTVSLASRLLASQCSYGICWVENGSTT